MPALISICIIFSSMFGFADPMKTPMTTIDGQKTNLKALKGKAYLVTNIATRCGYTPQLEGLESLYQKYKKKGLVIVGVPSNDYGEQTPEKNKDVKSFCKLNYDVSFPLTEKMQVKGEKKAPLFAEILKGSTQKEEIQWNFEKFLLDSNGKVIGRFASADKPLGKKLLSAVEKELNAKP